MRTIRQLSRLAFVTTMPALWSAQAISMMGTDGPQPCETTECFVEAVSACKANASYMTRNAAGAMVQYQVEGEAEQGGCQLGMIYMKHPNNDWTYKPLHFVLDPDGDVEKQLKETVAECLSGGHTRQCHGPLLEVIDTAGE